MECERIADRDRSSPLGFRFFLRGCLRRWEAGFPDGWVGGWVKSCVGEYVRACADRIEFATWLGWAFVGWLHGCVVSDEAEAMASSSYVILGYGGDGLGESGQIALFCSVLGGIWILPCRGRADSNLPQVWLSL